MFEYESLLQAYRKDIKSCVVLPKDEQERLVLEYQKTKDVSIQHKIVKSNMKLVAKIVLENKSRFGTVDVMDMIQEGNLGVIKAMDGFKTGKVNFPTYASFWVRSNLQRCFVKHANKNMGGTMRKLHDPVSTSSTDQPMKGAGDSGSDEGARLGDRLESDFDLEKQTEDLDVSEVLRHQIADMKLSDQEKWVLKFRLLSTDPMTHGQLGKTFNVSKQRMYNVEKDLLAKLKKEIKL